MTWLKRSQKSHWFSYIFLKTETNIVVIFSHTRNDTNHHHHHNSLLSLTFSAFREQKYSRYDYDAKTQRIYKNSGTNLIIFVVFFRFLYPYLFELKFKEKCNHFALTTWAHLSDATAADDADIIHINTHGFLLVFFCYLILVKEKHSILNLQ